MPDRCAPAVLPLPAIVDAPRISVSAGVGATGAVTQRQGLLFKRLFIDRPTLILVDHGVKALHWGHGSHLVHAGEAVALAGGHAFDVINHPAPDGEYRARWLAFDDEAVALHAQAHAQQAPIRNTLHIPNTDAALRQAFHSSFDRAVEAVEAATKATLPVEIARHRLVELLLWLGLAGGRFEPSCPVTLEAKIRSTVGQDPARDWAAADIAGSFAMSEATMRRKLAAEGTTLSALLVDARMSLALQLLQSTAQPVSQIALAVGYQTPSQFTARFRQRFGFAPTAIRGHRRLESGWDSGSGSDSNANTAGDFVLDKPAAHPQALFAGEK